MKTAILQVLGDPRVYKSARYVIDGKYYSTKFLALAIREWLGKGEIIFLVPDSLITKIESNVDEAFKILKDKKKFKRRIEEILDGIEADILIIPSVGKYSEDYTVHFEGSIENTIVFIFKELVKREIDEIYADVSTGLNIYVTSMLEALRKYLAYKKLEGILQGKRIDSNLAFVPQVLSEGQVVNVELQSFEVQVFFSLPNANPRDICMDREMRIEISRRYRDLFKEISEILKTLKIAFNSIKYNTPLALYSLNLNLDVERVKRMLLKVLDEIEDLRDVVLNDDTITVKRSILKSRNLINTFFAISMLSSIIEWSKGLRYPELEEILRNFGTLYKCLGLEVNSRFLEREIEEIRELARDLRGEKLLLELFPSGKSKDKKRNFFAHSGFLKEITLVKREGDRITLRYTPESIREVQSWLLDPD